MPEPTDEELGIPASLEDPNIRQELRSARLTSRERDSAVAEAEAAKRELAFIQAGIPETGTGALLRKAYDGDLSPEAIKAAATEAGINGPTTQETERAAEMERLRQLGEGGGQPPSFKPEAKVDFAKSIMEAQSEAEVWAVIQAKGQEAGVRRYVQ